jgi:hypothetical protein
MVTGHMWSLGQEERVNHVRDKIPNDVIASYAQALLTIGRNDVCSPWE